MRQQRAGQATFIPLDRIQVAPVPEKLRNFAKGARLAIDCIEADAAVEKAIRYACGSTLICDTSAIARNICYDKRQDVKGALLNFAPVLTFASRHPRRHCHSQERSDHWWSRPRHEESQG